MQIAKIAVEAATYAIDKPYSYGVPAGMAVSVGCRVLQSLQAGPVEVQLLALLPRFRTAKAGHARPEALLFFPRQALRRWGLL